MGLNKADKALFSAIEWAKPLEEIKKALADGASPNCSDGGRRSPLSLAIGLSRIYAIEPLIQAGARIEGKNLFQPPIFFATHDEHAEVLALMLRLGADPNSKGEYGQSALMNVVLSDAPKLVKLLLEAGADPNFRDRSQRTVLHRAAEHSNLKTVQCLVAGGAFVDLLDASGRTPAETTENPKIREFLEQTRQSGKNLATPEQLKLQEEVFQINRELFQAIDAGDINQVRLKIAEDANPNSVDFSEGALRTSALHRSVLRGDPEIIQYLLKSGAFSSFDALGRTPFDFAPDPQFKAWMLAWKDSKLPIPPKAAPRKLTDLPLTSAGDANSSVPSLITPKLWARISKDLAKDCALASFKSFTRDPGPLVSKVGGRLYAEEGEEWPNCSDCNEPMSGIFQINLNDAPEPQDAILSIYLCSKCNALEGSSDEQEGSALRYHPAPSKSKAIKESRSTEGEVKDARLLFKSAKSLPDPVEEILQSELEKLSAEAEIEPETLEEAYFNEVSNYLGYDISQSTRIGGYPGWIQEPLNPVCHCKADMKFMFQLHSAEEAGLMWVDDGVLYFFQCPNHPDHWEFNLQYH
jgi:ankyrin repeat protein/uncharacterized protein YwqG